MFQDHKDNILAAEVKYKGLPVVFTGQVESVAKDRGGKIHVTIKADGFYNKLRCYPWETMPQTQELSKLKKGDLVRVSG